MPHTPYRLAAAILAVTLFAQSFAPSVAASSPSSPSDISLAARLGAELGALASAGANLAPSAGAEAAAQANPSPAPTDTPAPPPTPTPAPTEVPHKGKLIFIDPGHGGEDKGAVHTRGDGVVDVTESESNLAIALKLADMLRQDGYDVAMARTIDQFVIPGAGDVDELQARLDMANDAGADLYVTIHNNGSENPAVHGTEVWYCGDRAFSEDNARLAGLVEQALVRNLRQAGYDTEEHGTKDDIRMGHFAVIGPDMERPSRMPGIIGESLFLSNDGDAAALGRDDIRSAIARGYFEGIKAYFGDGS